MCWLNPLSLSRSATATSRTGRGPNSARIVVPSWNVCALLADVPVSRTALFVKEPDDLGIANNTIVIYTTDNGPHHYMWPDASFTLSSNLPLERVKQLAEDLVEVK